METLLPHTRRPDITFYRNGKIYISAHVARNLAIRPGSTIDIIVTQGEYLLYSTCRQPSPRRFVARCYQTRRGENTYRACSVTLCRALMQRLGIADPKIAFAVGDPMTYNGITCLPIITKHPL